MGIRYNHTYYDHKDISELLLARVTRIATEWVNNYQQDKDYDISIIFATDDESTVDITHLLLQGLWREPPEYTFLVNAKQNTPFTYDPTLLKPDWELKEITQIKGSFFLDNVKISGVMLLCPLNFSPTLSRCPNCQDVWDVRTGCNTCGLNPDDLR